MLKFTDMWRVKAAAAGLVLMVLSVRGPFAADEVTPAALFQQVENRFAALTSMSYTVKRSVSSKRQKAEDQWLFRYSSPDMIRIDYLAPHERTIITDGKTLLEYIPEAQKAMKTDLLTMPKEKREKTLAAVMSRTSVDGLRLGNYEEMLKRAKRVQPAPWVGNNVYLVEGADPRYVVYIDRERSVLVRMEVYDKKGTLVVRTEASRFIEVVKGFWMPQEILATYNSPEGFVQGKIIFQDIKVNEPLGREIFSFSLPKGVETILN